MDTQNSKHCEFERGIVLDDQYLALNQCLGCFSPVVMYTLKLIDIHCSTASYSYHTTPLLLYEVAFLKILVQYV